MPREIGTHENFHRADEIKGSSERAFGLFFACVFCLVALWQWWQGSPGAGWWLLPGAAFAAAALLAPGTLRPFNRLWMKLGMLMFHVVNPLILGVMFFLVFLPIGLMMRIAGKDPLRLKFDPASDTYWIKREPPGPEPQTMKNQF